MIAPACVGAGTSTAGIRAIDHVVMDERRAVDHLHDSAQANGAFTAMPASSGGKQEQGGTHPLAAALAQITGYLDDRVNRAAILGGDLLLNESQIVPDQIKNAFRSEERRVGKECRSRGARYH